MAFVCQPAAPRKTEVWTSNREASEAHRARICGPTPMRDAVKAVLPDLGVPDGQIRTEAFGTDRHDPTRRTGKSGRCVGKVRFLDTGKTSTSWDGATLLDVADEAKVRIDSACRFGTCGTYRVKLKTEKSGCPCRTHSATPIGRMSTSWPAKPSQKVRWRWKPNASFGRASAAARTNSTASTPKNSETASCAK
jgi:ferredoxin